MSETTFGVNDAMTVKLWAKKLQVEALKETYIGRFIGTDANSLIHKKEETNKSAGDRVTFGLRMQLTGDGVTEGQVLEGNEEALSIYSDNLVINELMHAVRVKNKGHSIDAQRVHFDLRSEAKDGLRDWFAGRFDTVFFNHIAGNTAVTDSRYTGNNATSAPTSTRWIRAGAQASDQALTSSHTFDLTLIDKAKEVAKTASPKIRPVMVDGEECYVMFLHDYQETSLRTNTSTGQWLDIQKAAMAGMQSSKSPIFKGSLGMYNNVILHVANRLPLGINASTGATISTVRRAVLCGAQAAVIGFAQDTKDNLMFDWVEDTFDYKRGLGVSGQTIWGMKKSVFNSVDFGTVVVSSYAAAAS